MSFNTLLNIVVSNTKIIIEDNILIIMMKIPIPILLPTDNLNEDDENN